MQNMKAENAELGDRFSFGKNWQSFIKRMNDDRIHEAQESLKKNLGIEDLNGKVFLDVGCGSGLFSLAAHRLGATVYSFDYDDDSVKCSQFLKESFGSKDREWTIEQGSVLDEDFLKKFGKADIVYSWGVLHHTGNMLKAFNNVAPMVCDGGKLFISIYNDQGGASKRWVWVKKKYNKGSKFVKLLLSFYVIFRSWSITFIKDFIKTGNPFKTWFNYGKNNRGMSAWHDVVDWAGGYPFEVAKPEDVFYFFKNKGFELERLKTCAGGLGCNEFVFIKL